jgi:hypothetical protein
VRVPKLRQPHHRPHAAPRTTPRWGPSWAASCRGCRGSACVRASERANASMPPRSVHSRQKCARGACACVCVCVCPQEHTSISHLHSLSRVRACACVRACVCVCTRVASASRYDHALSLREQHARKRTCCALAFLFICAQMRVTARAERWEGGRGEGVRGGEVKCVVSTNQYHITHSTTPRQHTVGWPLHHANDDTQCVCQAVARPRAPAPYLSPPHHPPPASWPGAI